VIAESTNPRTPLCARPNNVSVLPGTPRLQPWTGPPLYGDNLDVLPQISDESVDLICLDPPLNSNRSYNVLFRGHGAAPFWFGSAHG
jgi:hypothetical protein